MINIKPKNWFFDLLKAEDIKRLHSKKNIITEISINV